MRGGLPYARLLAISHRVSTAPRWEKAARRYFELTIASNYIGGVNGAQLAFSDHTRTDTTQYTCCVRQVRMYSEVARSAPPSRRQCSSSQMYNSQADLLSSRSFSRRCTYRARTTSGMCLPHSPASRRISTGPSASMLRCGSGSASTCLTSPSRS